MTATGQGVQWGSVSRSREGQNQRLRADHEHTLGARHCGAVTPAYNQGMGSRQTLAPMLLLIVATAGCIGDECESFVSPCPVWFDLTNHCGQTRSCTVDGVFVTATKIQPNEVLAVPLDGLGDRLALIHDLFICYAAGDPMPAGAPDVRNAIVALDGEIGTHVGAAERQGLYGEIVRWQSFPSDPQRLEVHYEDVPIASRTVLFWFEDAACENDNPRPECEL